MIFCCRKKVTIKLWQKLPSFTFIAILECGSEIKGYLKKANFQAEGKDGIWYVHTLDDDVTISSQNVHWVVNIFFPPRK